MKTRVQSSAPERELENAAKKDFDPGQPWEDTGKLDRNLLGRFSNGRDIANKAGIRGGLAKKEDNS